MSRHYSVDLKVEYRHNMGKQLREGLARLADLVDPAHLKAVERLQEDIWAHRPTERIPCFCWKLARPSGLCFRITRP